MSAMPTYGPIVIDGRAAVRAEVGGVERWAREMAARLPALEPDRYVVAAPPRGFAHRAGHLWEQAVLPVEAALRRASLVYCPAILAPVAWPRTVVALHDVVALAHPEFYSRGYVAWQRTILPAIARRARRIVTVSEFSRREISDQLGVEPELIAVVPGGVDERFSPAADAERASRALGLARPYVLTVGTASGRKNPEALAAVAGPLAEAGFELVAAGGTRGYLAGAAGGDRVRRLGYVDEEHLPGLYAGARAFVLPSRHEGFGLPCLEAMAAGVPVVASSHGALPETCGEAALLVDPDDTAALAAALLRAAQEGPEHERLRAAGLERAAGFSWNRAARTTNDLLLNVAGGSAPAGQ